MFGICQNLKNNSCLSIKVTTGIFLIKVFSEVSVRLERSVNRKHSQGSDVLPPGVVKYLCEGAVCDDPSPTPFFSSSGHSSLTGLALRTSGRAGESSTQAALCSQVHFTTEQQN